jgi:hypothetical protein
MGTFAYRSDLSPPICGGHRIGRPHLKPFSPAPEPSSQLSVSASPAPWLAIWHTEDVAYRATRGVADPESSNHPPLFANSSTANNKLVRCSRATSCQGMPVSADSKPHSKLRLAFGFTRLVYT